ncbi:MAG: GTP-binding protein, partial [Pseudonocardia sp.]|nr:GTP-binding protein [Pseudonocardia sp.]
SASTSTATSQRTGAFLDPDDETPTEADAVVYLMRHLHAADAEFLESFRDRGVARATAVNTVAVISRADEIGGGRADAMFSARGIAQRYRTDPTVRGLCQNVVAVAGLLAQTGRTLRHAEYTALAGLAALPRADLDATLLSVSRFRRAGGELSTEARDRLVRRFGLFGVRLSATLIRQGTTGPDALATELVARSGLNELQSVLHTQFSGRRDLLKARSALLALDGLRGPRDGPLAREVERILAGAHECPALGLLGALRSGAVGLPRPAADEAERLLGDAGAAVQARLGLPPDAPLPALRHAAFAALERWQRHAANPMFARATTDACHVVIRSCEGLLADLAARPEPVVPGHRRADAY